jgi:membrane associated rhomboid family serine protease
MIEGTAEATRFELEPRGCFVALTPEGVRLGLRRHGLETELVPFSQLTHVEATRLGVWLATKKTTRVLRRSLFRDERDPDELVQAIRWRLADEPGGADQLARMREVAERALHPLPRRATTVLAVVCLAVFVLQWTDPMALEFGVFYPDLVSLGEYWRIVTGNLMHGMSLLPLHLVINMLCLMAFGLLVERAVGAARTFLVMGASGLGAMAASALAGYDEVLGASGIVAGLVGAVLWLEFNEAERMPAWWRIPRRLFLIVVILQGVLDQMLPFIAAAAHLGGLAAGYAVMPFASRGGLERQPLVASQRVAVAVLALGIALAGYDAGRLILRSPDALASFGEDLLASPRVAAHRLNDLAWLIATESEPNAAELQVAARLAERAVDQTGRLDPNVLDTLAEVLFVAGDAPGAIHVIDEAIHLAGQEIYFREQRRRFTGERDADDRPAPPGLPVLPAPPIRLVPPGDPGFSI